MLLSQPTKTYKQNTWQTSFAVMSCFPRIGLRTSCGNDTEMKSSKDVEMKPNGFLNCSVMIVKKRRGEGHREGGKERGKGMLVHR